MITMLRGLHPAVREGGRELQLPGLKHLNECLPGQSSCQGNLAELIAEIGTNTVQQAVGCKGKEFQLPAKGRPSTSMGVFDGAEVSEFM